LKRLIASVEK